MPLPPLRTSPGQNAQRRKRGTAWEQCFLHRHFRHLLQALFKVTASPVPPLARLHLAPDLRMPKHRRPLLVGMLTKRLPSEQPRARSKLEQERLSHECVALSSVYLHARQMRKHMNLYHDKLQFAEWVGRYARTSALAKRLLHIRADRKYKFSLGFLTPPPRNCPKLINNCFTVT